MTQAAKLDYCKNLILISDTHSGCGMALCPLAPVSLDDGGEYHASKLQAKIHKYWEMFRAWCEKATHGDPYTLIHHGDMVDGKPFGSVTQISDNLDVQSRIALELMKMFTDDPKCERYYQIRGTEAHVRKSAQHEEMIARELRAVPTPDGRHSRYESWIWVGPRDKGRLVQSMHHIGTTASQSYESTAPHKELVENFVESARWGERPADIIVRGHRHRCFHGAIPSEVGEETSQSQVLVLPGWQAKTPFAYKVGRMSPPQFGGAVIRWHADTREASIRPWVKSVRRPEPE